MKETSKIPAKPPNKTRNASSSKPPRSNKPLRPPPGLGPAHTKTSNNNNDTTHLKPKLQHQTVETNQTKQHKSNQKSDNEKQLNSCLICAQLVPGQERVDILAFGKCDHQVCYVCSARMRVICEQNECPICREKLEHVIFSNDVKPYETMKLDDYTYDAKFKIYFATKRIKSTFDKLLRYDCLQCNREKVIPVTQTKDKENVSSANTISASISKNRDAATPSSGLSAKHCFEDNVDSQTSNKSGESNLQPKEQAKKVSFDSIEQLANHLDFHHKLMLCDLCLRHNKLFSFEYSYYDKKSLLKHMNEGEKNTPHRGHPVCKLCRCRFFNQDELLTHMSKDHFHCHFCGRSSSNMRIYFLDYPSLRTHFKSSHFLCEKGNCRDEQFTSAFENEFDYQMHLVHVHGNPFGSLRNSEARQQRTILLEPSSYRSQTSSSSTSNVISEVPGNSVIARLPVAVANSSMRNRPAISPSLTTINSQRVPSKTEFPALNNFNESSNTAASVPIAGSSSAPNQETSFVRTAGGGRSTNLGVVDFPPLPNQPKSKSKSSTKAKPTLNKQTAVKPPQTIDQLFNSSVKLNHKTGKSKPLKLQIS